MSGSYDPVKSRLEEANAKLAEKWTGVRPQPRAEEKPTKFVEKTPHNPGRAKPFGIPKP